MVRMGVMDRHLHHHGVQADRARMVGHDQGTTLGRHVVDPADLDPEPVLVERAQRSQQDAVVELGIEAELIHLVLAQGAPAQELQRLTDLIGPARAVADHGHVAAGRLVGAGHAQDSRVIHADHPDRMRPATVSAPVTSSGVMTLFSRRACTKSSNVSAVVYRGV